jgi:glycosyltransferase involved in cell wall biosynthesis
MLRLTIVVLSYNHAPFIRQALESFIAQKTNFDYQIIIADDESTDGTVEIIREYEKRYKNLIIPIFREKNIGVLPNYLDACSKAKTEYVAYCECDDFFTDPYKLQKQVDFLDAHKDCSICFHNVRMFYEDKLKKNRIVPKKKSRFHKTLLSIDDLLKDNFVPSNSVVYRWRFVEENIYDFFPPDILPADYYMHLLHAQYGNIGFIDQVMSAYRVHSQGIWYSDDIVNEKYGEKRLLFYFLVWKNIADFSNIVWKANGYWVWNSFIKFLINSNQKDRYRHFIEQTLYMLKDVPMDKLANLLYGYYREISLMHEKLMRKRFNIRLLIILAIIEFLVIVVLWY